MPGLARATSPTVVNPWGLAYSPTGPFWFSENGAGVSDLLDGRGQSIPMVVTVPAVGGAHGTPTGVVFNGGAGFVISANDSSHPGRFIFASEDGTISAWNSFVDPTQALVVVDRSGSGAVYDGLALGADSAGQDFLYAADFAHGTIDIFDQNFYPVTRPGAFQDANIPAGFAPFNVQNIDGLLYVTYARQDDAGDDPADGPGNGFVDVFDTTGVLVQRLAAQGELNSPWGLAVAPANFGPFGGALLVGNNGDGRILAYDAHTGAFLGNLADDAGSAIVIPDLWALSFGNDHAGGASDTLFFAAGVDYEAHGLFGAIQSPQNRGSDTGGAGVFDPHAPGEPNDYPLPPSNGPALQTTNSPTRTTTVLLPLADASLALVPTLSSVTPTVARSDAPTSTAAMVPVSFDHTSAPVFLASSTMLLGLGADDSQLASVAPSSSASLNAFLDLQSAPMRSDAIERQAADSGQQPVDNWQQEVATAGDVNVPGSTDLLPAADCPLPAALPGNRLGLLKNLFLAVSIPVVWGYLLFSRNKPCPTGEEVNGPALAKTRVSTQHSR